MYLEQSYQLPATEGVTDSAWVIPDDVNPIVTNLVSETQHHVDLYPATLPYANW